MRVGLPRERADGHYARARADGAADAAAAPTAGERRAPAARHPLLNLRASRSWRQCQCGPLSARRRGMRVHSHSQTRRLVGGSCWGVAAPSRKFLQSGAEELLAILGRWHTRISATRHSTASADRMYFITCVIPLSHSSAPLHLMLSPPRPPTNRPIAGPAYYSAPVVAEATGRVDVWNVTSKLVKPRSQRRCSRRRMGTEG
ncbi:hypothetical protein B0H14DRAFT_1479677 [Mycena olivaceomarginata]|nr:hypothetical protein B0H14DRAFT_1479677 [Mycena olivaceomarginata]